LASSDKVTEVAVDGAEVVSVLSTVAEADCDAAAPVP
jgi:hypothetical protein